MVMSDVPKIALGNKSVLLVIVHDKCIDNTPLTFCIQIIAKVQVEKSTLDSNRLCHMA